MSTTNATCQVYGMVYGGDNTLDEADVPGFITGLRGDCDITDVAADATRYNSVEKTSGSHIRFDLVDFTYDSNNWLTRANCSTVLGNIKTQLDADENIDSYSDVRWVCSRNDRSAHGSGSMMGNTIVISGAMWDDSGDQAQAHPDTLDGAYGVDAALTALASALGDISDLNWDYLIWKTTSVKNGASVISSAVIQMKGFFYNFGSYLEAATWATLKGLIDTALDGVTAFTYTSLHIQNSAGGAPPPPPA